MDSTIGSRKSRSVVSRSSTIDTGRFSLESRSTVATSVSHGVRDKTPSPGRARKSASPQSTHELKGMSPKRDIFSIDENRDTNAVGVSSALLGALADRSDADLDSQLDLARRNSASVAVSEYAAACHAAYGSMNGKSMRYEGTSPSPRLSQSCSQRLVFHRSTFASKRQPDDSEQDTFTANRSSQHHSPDIDEHASAQCAASGPCETQDPFSHA